MPDEPQSAPHHDHNGAHPHGMFPGDEDRYGRAFFDANAATWDAPDKIERAGAVAERIAATIPLHSTTRFLEYGAGTGLVTQALRQHVGPVTLAEPSAGMRAVIESKIDAAGLTDARLWDLDLEEDEPPDERFDVIVTAMVLHHVHALDRVLAGFLALLEPGGHLCVVDLDFEGGTFHGEGFTGHPGFHRDRFGDRLRAAGFTNVEISDCYQMLRNGIPYTLFLAVAQSPAIR
ncbi:MAG: class I SAM-dependent methyltransferase [Acidimicrobiales bacterium]|nr:class I SAM-dependent methyltransferase [Acidimicrobiales bacterium]